jgi:uncharacterized SAM-binding protein YcdF (DUF218 family)
VGAWRSFPVPRLTTRTGGLFRRILAVSLLLVLGGAVYLFVQAGSLLTHEDPLRKADAIVVLAGTRMTRPLEGADLYLEGYAPRIVLTREPQDAGDTVVAKRGFRVQADADRARDVFIDLGVPRDAILVPDRIHDSTAAEAITVRELAAQHHWRTVIVVTSRFHLTRAGFAVRRELAGSSVEVVMRASRYDPLRPEQWWARRGETRWVVAEFPKLIAYLLGLGAD